MSSFLTIDKNIIEEVSCLKDFKDEGSIDILNLVLITVEPLTPVKEG